jgi:predicted nucleic acid-binding protein
VDITPTILARVRRPFPMEPVRTLDAIHLATIESIEEEPSVVAVVTRDRRLAENARAMGYVVE